MMFNTSQPPASTRYLRIPLKHLTDKTRSVLSVSLNNKKHIRAENGFCRDWRGIIELCGLRKGYYDIVDNSSDHMEKLLELWCLKEGDLCPKANVEQLLQFLEEIERFDVADDIKDIIADDVQKFEEFESKNISQKDIKYEKPITSPLPVERNEVLTLQDLKRIEEGKPLRNYDAFLLFEDEDAEFVQTLLAKLSNYHICMKSDLVRQTFEHTAVVELIEKRCRRVIAVISEHFLYSPSNANRFLVDFAQASQVESGDLRIIPVVTEREVEKYIPSNLKYLHKVQYYKNSPLYDFWRILESTLMDKSALYNKMQQITMAESVRKNVDSPSNHNNNTNNSNNTNHHSPNNFHNNNQQQPPPSEPPNNNLRHSISMTEILEQAPNPPTNTLINTSMTNLAESRRSKKKWYKKFFSKSKDKVLAN